MTCYFCAVSVVVSRSVSVILVLVEFDTVMIGRLIGSTVSADSVVLASSLLFSYWACFRIVTDGYTVCPASDMCRGETEVAGTVVSEIWADESVASELSDGTSAVGEGVCVVGIVSVIIVGIAVWAAVSLAELSCCSL